MLTLLPCYIAMIMCECARRLKRGWGGGGGEGGNSERGGFEKDLCASVALLFVY